MGINARAGLFYGYCWHEPIDLFGEDEDGDPLEWESAVARKRDVADDSETRRAVRAEFGVRVGSHGVDGWRMPYLYIDGQRRFTEAGTALGVTAPGPGVNPAWGAALDRWFEATGVEKPHPQPRWWLVAWL